MHPLNEQYRYFVVVPVWVNSIVSKSLLTAGESKFATIEYAIEIMSQHRSTLVDSDWELYGVKWFGLVRHRIFLGDLEAYGLIKRK